MSAHMSDVVVEMRPIRKRTWTPAEKLQIMREAFKPDACATEIMRRHGISSSLFYTWRKKFLAASPAGFMPVRIAPTNGGTRSSAPAPTPAPEATNAMSAPGIEVRTPGGIVVRIESGADVKTLAAALKAVCG